MVVVDDRFDEQMVERDILLRQANYYLSFQHRYLVAVNGSLVVEAAHLGLLSGKTRNDLELNYIKYKKTLKINS